MFYTHQNYKGGTNNLNWLRFTGMKPQKIEPIEITIEKPIDNERTKENDRQEEFKQLTIKFM